MTLRIISFLIPYITIGLSLFVFHSAWMAILSYHIGIIAVVLLSGKRLPVKDLFKSVNYKAPAIMMLIGAGAGLLVYLLWPLLTTPGQISSHVESIGLTGRTWPLFIGYFVLANALLEEYLWRGILVEGKAGFTLDEVFFSGYHVLVLAAGIGASWLVMIFIVLALVAWLWKKINRLSEGLLPSVACHVAADISVMLAAYARIY